MAQYTETPAIINLGSAPPIPDLAWSVEDRLALSRRQCERTVSAEVMEERRARLRARGSKREPSAHPGRGRRHRREVRTRQGLDFIAGRPAPAVEGQRAELGGHTIHELLYAPIPNAPSWALALRMQGRELLDLVKRHGPVSGWGLPQPAAGSERNPKWTPFYIPKKSEGCWRWWRQALLFLIRVLVLLARAWWRLVPLHRTRPEGATAEKRGGVLLASQLVEPSGCRDQSPSGVGAILSQMLPGLGM